MPNFHLVSGVVLSGHDLGPRRGADRVGKAVGEADAFLGQLVQVGRLAGFASVGGQGFVAHVVGHDEDGVGRARAPRAPQIKKKKHRDDNDFIRTEKGIILP